MFTDEEKEYVLLAYYLGRKKLLNCIALQQLTKDILDVFHFENRIAIYNGKNINSATGCCLCKEKETIFKDFLEYYLLKDSATGCEEVHEQDVDNVWADISRLWINLHKYDGHMSGRQLILNYEKAGEALMRKHNVKIYDYIRKKNGDLENLENWSRIVYKVQSALKSLGETLESMCGSEAPVQSVHKVPNSGESVRVAPITLNVRGNAPIIAKYAMQSRAHGIEVTAESGTSVRMKYMVCLKCSMENDYSQPISLMGLHSKYLNICQQMFLVFEKRLRQNGHSIELENFTPFSTTSRNDDPALLSVAEQKSKSCGEDVVDFNKTVQAMPCSYPTYPKKMITDSFAPPTSTLQTIHQPSKENQEHASEKSCSKKAHKTRKEKRKHDRISHVLDWSIKYIDDRPKHETLTDSLGEIEKFIAKFKRIGELKKVPGLRRRIPVPDMPIMSKFKVHRPAEGEPWPLCHDFPEDNFGPTVPPPRANTPAVTETFQCDLRISMDELFDDRDCTLFPELGLDYCDEPAFELDKSTLNPSRGIQIVTPFHLNDRGSSKQYCNKPHNTPLVSPTHSPKSQSDIEVKLAETDILKSDGNSGMSAVPDTLEVALRKTVGPLHQIVEKIDNEVGDGLCNIASGKDPSVACDNADDDDANFREPQDSNEDTVDVVEEDGADSGSKSEFSIYVAEYLARYVPDLDESLKSFLARRQRAVKAKTEPAKLHFSHYLCSLDGAKTNESLSNDFTCSKFVQVGSLAKTTAYKHKSCEWVSRSLSRMSRLVLHEHILLEKQAVIDRQMTAKSVPKKTKSAKSRKWKNRIMKNSIETVACASLSTDKPLSDDKPDSIRGRTVSDDATQCHSGATTTEQCLNNSTVNDEMTKPPWQRINNDLSLTVNEGLQSDVGFNQISPACEITKPDNHCGVIRNRSVDEHSNWKVRQSHSTMPTNSSDALLRMRCKRDSDGNWKHVEYKKNLPSGMKAKLALFRSPASRNTSVSEFHHKLSTISRHKPPKISKLSTRNQSIVQNFFNYFKKSKEKRRRSMANMNRSLLFSSSYLPSFEEIGFTAINPSPHVFSKTPKLEQISMSRRQKSLPDISRLVTKPHDTVASIPFSHLPSETLRLPYKHHTNLVAVTNRDKKAIPSSSSTTTTDCHTKLDSEMPSLSGHNKIQRVDKLRSSNTSVSAKSAEFAVTALQLSHSYASADDIVFTDTHADFDSRCCESNFENEDLISQQQSWESKPVTTVSTSEILMSKKSGDGENKAPFISEEEIDPWPLIRTPLSESEQQTGKSLKVFAKSVMTASTNFDCSYATTEYKYHLTYESILTILNSIAQECKPGHFDHGIPESRKQITFIDRKLWKSSDRLSLALKYCFASRNRTPASKRRSNKRIGKSLASYNKFWNRTVDHRLLNKKSLNLKDELKVTYHRYWWSVPSHDLYKKKQVKSLAHGKFKPMECSFRRKFECDVSSKSDNGNSKMESHVLTDAASNDEECDFNRGFMYTRTRSRLKSLTKSDKGTDTKAINYSNHSSVSSPDAKTDSDDTGSGLTSNISSHENMEQSGMRQKGNKRKRKFDATDSLSSLEGMRALMNADETNMKRYAKRRKIEQNARCLQALFESSLNIRSVNRVLFDSANAKSFSLVPPELTQNTPAIFELGNQSLSLLQVCKDASVNLDPKNGNEVQSTGVTLDQCPLATAKLGNTVSIPRTLYLLRFKSKRCSPEGLSRAKRRSVSWDFDELGRRPKNVGIRTPSRGFSVRKPSWNIDEISFELFGKIPIVIIPKI